MYRETWPGLTPRRAQISCASAGWERPVKTFSGPYKAGELYRAGARWEGRIEGDAAGADRNAPCETLGHGRPNRRDALRCTLKLVHMSLTGRARSVTFLPPHPYHCKINPFP